jgi:hypothetical protein
MTEKRKIIKMTLPMLGATFLPREGEKYFDKAEIDKMISDISEEMDGYSHKFIYTYEDGSTEER